MKKFNMIDMLQNGTLNYVLRFSLVLILASVVSTITYKIIEVPFQNWSKKIIDKWEKA
jgi:peptidoglycan/LPS O-acetylase OafA/YrhL